MGKILAYYAVVIFILTACEGKPDPSKEGSNTFSLPKVIVEKEKKETEKPFPPEVKIKLKKDGKDNYSWELSGSDVNQILKVNEKLKKQLGEQTK